MVANRRTLMRLSWVLVVLAIVSAIVGLLFAFGILLPPHDDADFVDRLVANRTSDEQAFPFVLIGSVATIGVYLIAAMFGLLLRAWARPSSLRDAMTLLLVVAGVVGIIGQLMNIGVGQAANPFYCDCGYRTEEVIGLNQALQVGWSMVSWIGLGAITLVGFGAGVAGRVVEVSPTWRTLSTIIAIALLVGVLLKVIGAFIFVEAFDPFQISDLISAVTLGVLVPIWAILLARGVQEPDQEMAKS